MQERREIACLKSCCEMFLKDESEGAECIVIVRELSDYFCSCC